MLTHTRTRFLFPLVQHNLTLHRLISIKMLSNRYMAEMLLLQSLDQEKQVVCSAPKRNTALPHYQNQVASVCTHLFINAFSPQWLIHTNRIYIQDKWKENGSNWLLDYNTKQTKKSDKGNFMPKTAIYCPLLTSWLTEQQGLHCSKQPILTEKAHAAITGEQPIILYQELIMPSDKQQCRRLKMKWSKDKAGSSLQAAPRWREMQVWWGKEAKRRVRTGWKRSFRIPVRSRGSEVLLQMPNCFGFHSSKAITQLATKAYT